MSDTNKEIKKFLDIKGLEELWGVIRGKFDVIDGKFADVNGVINNIASDEEIKDIFK